MTGWEDRIDELDVNWDAKPGVRLDYVPDRSEDARWSDLMRMLDEQAEESKRQQRRYLVATCAATLASAALGALLSYLLTSF